MATDLEDREASAANTSELLSGILDDLHILLEKQFQLVRSQIELDIQRRLNGAILIGIGISVLLISGAVASFAMAQGIHWFMDPSTPAISTLPLWVCQTLVAVALFLVSIFSIQFGRKKLLSIHLTEDRNE